MDKKAIIAAVIAELEKEAEQSLKAAQSTFESATDEESKAESKYDTRGLEASYLAGGQARRAAEAQDALARFNGLFVKAFMDEDAIALSALIAVESRGAQSYYLLGPASGGLEVKVEGKEVMIITPQSPIGRSLLGKRVGDFVDVQMGRRVETLKIINVA